MSLTAAARGFVVFLLTVPALQGLNGWDVIYESTQICALKGSTVEISCTYTFPSRTHTVKETFWFTKDSNDVYVDLRTDPDYSGRVEYHCVSQRCTLKLKNLTESDSAVYMFRFLTNDESGKYSGKPGATLSVTGLQVQDSRSNTNRRLQCRSTCPLPDKPNYTWFKNGQNVKTSHSDSMSLSSFYPQASDRYSCAVSEHENSGSPVFVLGQDDWRVTYTSTQICALEGSTVSMSCAYTLPSTRYTVEERFWFKHNTDLRLSPEYSGRVQYDSGSNNCTVTIRDLRKSDSAVYKFRLRTKYRGTLTGEPGVTLSVTADPQLEVHVRRSTVNQYSNWTELTCHNKCQLFAHPKYMWYRNGQRVEKAGKKYFYPHPINPADRYHCTVYGNGYFSTHAVYAPKLPSVSVNPLGEIMEGTSVTLTCSSDANPAATYSWYKKNQILLNKEPKLVLRSIQSSDSGEYYCTAENELGRKTSEYTVDVKYAPRLPSVSVVPSGEVMEGSSVTLTCNSDANPPAYYTWYKENRELFQGSSSYKLPSISSKERGFYICQSENQHGQRNSSSLFIDVRYAPKLPSVLASPSAEIAEGSSMNLTCKSDANPAANYTWYKEKQMLLQGQEGVYHFTSISSEHSGNYSCKAENQHGPINSSSLFVDVQYAPKLHSVSVSPTGEIMEGSSVNLTCSSDANPKAIYIWYKETKDSPQASGQMFTIANATAEHSGSYYCEAQNTRGRHNSTFNLTVVAVFPAVWKSVVIGTTTPVFLAIIVLSVFLLIRRKRTSEQSSEPGDRPNNKEQSLPNQSEERDDIHYASIHFSKNQTDPVYSNVRPAGAHRRKDEEEDVVEYATVKFNSASAAPSTRGPETEEDPAALYSTVNKQNC